MPRTETITRALFTFEELNERAKENARDWFRECIDTQDYADHIIEDAKNIAALLGIDLDMRSKNEPCIWWSGFSNQGDGACFEGSYNYAKGAAKKIREYAPQDAKLHAIADGLQRLQRKYFYAVSATAKHSGYYYHSGCMQIDTSRVIQGLYDDYDDYLPSDDHDDLVELLRDFADWIYKKLGESYWYCMSDEYIDDSILANEYEFTEDGDRA